MSRVVGLLLAAGAGRRYGGPKALVDGWLDHAVRTLVGGGCDDVTVVLGAEAAQARPLVPEGVEVVVAEDWEEGMGASLRAGLRALPVGADAVVVHLVDLPDVGAGVVTRVIDGAGPASLRRSTYDGRPGHPVLIGREHWAGVAEVARGDRGARDYLAAHALDDVECGDLATGRDRDTRT